MSHFVKSFAPPYHRPFPTSVANIKDSTNDKNETNVERTLRTEDLVFGNRGVLL